MRCDWKEENIPRRLTTIRQRVVTFIRGITCHKRTAATHVLVFMVSPEERNRKPYALPVQCIPYTRGCQMPRLVILLIK